MNDTESSPSSGTMSDRDAETFVTTVGHREDDRIVLPYRDPPPSTPLTHPAAAVSGWALFAILVIVLAILSGYVPRFGGVLVYVLAVASLTALISGLIATQCLPPGTKNRGLGVVGMIVGALFAVLSIFWIYCMLTGISRYM
jgi:hypothetical protein